MGHTQQPCELGASRVLAGCGGREKRHPNTAPNPKDFRILSENLEHVGLNPVYKY